MHATPARQMGVRKSGVANEVDSVTKVLAGERQQMRDEVVAVYLLSRHPELSCDQVTFIVVPWPMFRRFLQMPPIAIWRDGGCDLPGISNDDTVGTGAGVYGESIMECE